MSHLLAISVGPVQDFIAAARRTRDLWFGSQLLSDISKAVAVELAKHGELIFPASVQEENVANVLLVELREDVDPSVVAVAGKNAARQTWKTQADLVRVKLVGAIRTEIWDEQVDDVIEVYVAWVPRSTDYRDDRKRLNRLLTGRKNARDFDPAKGKAGIPKSSLDGQRETVLNDPKQGGNGLRARLRLANGEQLDVVGLVKRLGGGSKQYPSVARIAADPWIRGIVQRDGVGSLSSLIAACDSAAVLNRLDQVVFSQFKDLPFEGTAVYATRHNEFREETGLDKNVDLPFSDPLRQLVRDHGEPNPYLAVLVADGDHVGAALSNKTTADEHRRFSKKLAEFSAGVKAIVEIHHGVLVYAGGDDVLAFLPVDKCLCCARELHNDFGTKMKDQGNDLTLTLSVGIGIGHFMENLEDLLQYGREAEKDAKTVEGKDALAIHVHKRGGAPIEVRASWKEDPVVHLTDMAKLINAKQLSGRVAYDLRRLADLYEDWPPNTVADAIQRDVLRILSAKKPEGGDKGTEAIRDLVTKRVTDSKSLESFAKELLVAKLIAEVMRQAKPKKAGER